LHEITLEITGIDPILFFGVNNSKLDEIRKYFPKLKIIARGSELKVIGDPDVVRQFEKKFDLMLRHIMRYNDLTENNIENLLLQDEMSIAFKDFGEIIVHGTHGRQIKARTANQRQMVKLAQENDMLFAVGPAGTGKTYTAVALAVRALKDKVVRRIILTRPAVESGENLGFLPGDMKDKLDPYMQPLYDALRDMMPSEKLADYIENGTLEIAPLAFMRGRTLDHAYVILDEAQNTTTSQMKMFLTRMGKNAHFIITGDVTQIDLPKKQQSGLVQALDYLNDVDGIGVVELDENDVVRHKLVKQIILAFKKREA
jgi:phosphate starvation-inducible PhoH-like protein